MLCTSNAFIYINKFHRLFKVPNIVLKTRKQRNIFKIVPYHLDKFNC